MVEIVVPFWVLPTTWLVLFSGGLMSAALSWIWDRSHEPSEFRGFNLKEVRTLLDDVLDPVFDSFPSLSLSIVSLVLMVAGLFTCTPAVFLGAEFVAEEALISGTIWLILLASAVGASALSWESTSSELPSRAILPALPRTLSAVRKSLPSLTFALCSVLIVLTMMLTIDWPTLFGYGLPQGELVAPFDEVSHVIVGWVAAIITSPLSTYVGVILAYPARWYYIT